MIVKGSLKVIWRFLVLLCWRGRWAEAALPLMSIVTPDENISAWSRRWLLGLDTPPVSQGGTTVTYSFVVVVFSSTTRKCRSA